MISCYQAKEELCLYTDKCTGEIARAVRCLRRVEMCCGRMSRESDRYYKNKIQAAVGMLEKIDCRSRQGCRSRASSVDIVEHVYAY